MNARRAPKHRRVGRRPSAETKSWVTNAGYGGGERFDEVVFVPEVTYRGFRSPDFQCGDFEAERAGRRLNLAQLQHSAGGADVGHDRQPAETGDNFAQEFDALTGKIGRLG